MKRFIETIKNIFKIEELRTRIVYTILLLLVYRLGSYVVLPGIDPTQLANLKSQASTGLLGLLDMFSGGAFGNASIFALGVMPYISASIVIQLLGVMVPYFQRMQREGESGRRKMNQWTRYLTIVILAAVITELEGVEVVVPSTVERFFTADLAFLQDMYQRINNVEPPTMKVVCPDCGKIHEVPINFTREG